MKKAVVIIVLAGPNGAGKSTFYEVFLTEEGLPFVNADRLAGEHYGEDAAENAYEAAKLADRERRTLVEAGASFIMETVLSDPVGDKVGFLARARDQGYFVSAHFIGLESPELSQARVVGRVEGGGHDVPDEKIRDRYPRTLENLMRLFDVADELTVYDNSFLDAPFRPVCFMKNGRVEEIADPLPRWARDLGLDERTHAGTKGLS